MAVTKNDAERRYAKLVAKAWSDDSFRQKLMSNGADVLRQAGFEIPAGKKVQVIEADMEQTIYLFIPPKPPDVVAELRVGAAALPCTVCCSWCGTCIQLCFPESPDKRLAP